jgi:hypothetical protein
MMTTESAAYLNKAFVQVHNVKKEGLNPKESYLLVPDNDINKGILKEQGVIAHPVELYLYSPDGTSLEKLYRIRYKNEVLDFERCELLARPDQIWKLESLVGFEVMDSQLKKHRAVNADFVKSALKVSGIHFYTDQKQHYLFSDKNELYEADFGPLKKISAVEAMRKFGIDTLEIAKEKGYSKLVL